MLADILTKQLPREAFERFQVALEVGEEWGHLELIEWEQLTLKDTHTHMHPQAMCV